MSAVTEPLISRAEWLLDPNVSFLNHGSFGAVPRAVLQAQRLLQEQMERNPTEFLTCELPKALRATAEKLTRLLGGVGNDDGAKGERLHLGRARAS